MDVKASLEIILSKLNDSGVNEDFFDEAIIDYLEESFKHTSDQDLDFAELASVCEAYIPNLAKLPRDEFVSWYLNTKSAFLHPSTEKSDSRSTSELCLVDNQDGPTSDLCVALQSSQLTSALAENVCEANAGSSIITSDRHQLRNKRHTKKSKSSSSKTEFGAEISSPTYSIGLEKLTEDERLSLFERYGFVQSDSKSVSCPEPLIAEEPKSKLRYLDGKVVDTKGKKYIEIKQEYPDMPQPTFLRALRRYKFH